MKKPKTKIEPKMVCVSTEQPTIYQNPCEKCWWCGNRRKKKEDHSIVLLFVLNMWWLDNCRWKREPGTRKQIKNFIQSNSNRINVKFCLIFTDFFFRFTTKLRHFSIFFPFCQTFLRYCVWTLNNKIEFGLILIRIVPKSQISAVYV